MDACGSYEGEYAHGRYNGAGRYENDQGVYVGDFDNGHFHGDGSLYLPQEKGGGRWEGYWENGSLIEGRYIFDDDLVYENEYWAFCSNKDPRFVKEIKDGISIKGPLRDIVVNPDNIDKLPPGCFDCVDGYLDPKSFIIREYGTDNELRRPTQEEREWAMQNCYSKPEEKKN